MRLPPRLRRGELIRLTADGPIHTVLRVTVGAAYVKVGDWTTGDPPPSRADAADVLSGLETKILSISPYSFVYRDSNKEVDDEATEV